MKIFIISVCFFVCSCSKDSKQTEVVCVVNENLLTNITIEKYYTEQGLALYNTVVITPNWEYVTKQGKLYYTPELPIGTFAIDAAFYGAESPMTRIRVEQAVGDAIRNYGNGEAIKKLTF